MIKEGELFAKRYLVREKLERGTAREIYLATDGGKNCLLKVLAEPLLRNAEYPRSFLRSAELRRRADHPHLVRLTDHGVSEGVPFCVSEPFYGKDLETIQLGRSHLPWGFVRDVALQACEGLSALHSGGVIHNDVKPAKILVQESMTGPVVKLLDSVFSVEDGDPVLRCLERVVFIGSIDFVPPERVSLKLMADRHDPRMDVYSMGATLYRLLSGHPPFMGATMMEALQARADQYPAEPEYPEASGTALPNEVKGLVMRAMGRLPGERFQSIAELRESILSA